MRRRLRLLLVCSIVLGGLLPASPALASTIIGQTSASSVQCVSAQVKQRTGATVSYAVPSAGTITSWSTDQGSHSGGSMSLLVLRAGTLVAKDGPRTLSAGLNTFTVSIPVQAGDEIAMHESSSAACFYSSVAGDTLDFLDTGTAPTVGSSPSFPFSQGSSLLNLSAVVAPAGPAVASYGHGAYCAATPVLRADGTVGTFLDLADGQPGSDPAYAGATRAVYGQGYGLTCDNLGGEGYTDSGTKVDQTGTHTGNPAWDVYEYYTKTSSQHS